MGVEQIIEYAKYTISVLAILGVVVEPTKIKIKPYSLLFKWIGEKINGELREDIKQLDEKIDTVDKKVGGVKTDLQLHVVENQRRTILEFASELRKSEKKTQEDYNYILKLYDDYEEYTRANNIPNSQIDLAYEFISKKHNEDDCFKD